MRKLVVTLSFVLMVTAIFAQKGKVTSASAYKESGELEKAVEAIEIAVDENNPKAVKKSIPWPHTWEVRGDIYRTIYTKGKTELSEEPLMIAFESFKKALELDENNRYSKDVVNQLVLLQIDLTSKAAKAFDEKDFEEALKLFETHMEVSAVPQLKESGNSNSIDSIIAYNAGLAAYQAKIWDKTVKYLRKSIALDYNAEDCFQYIYKSYLEAGDTATATEILKEGFNAFPENEILLYGLINYYIDLGDANEAVNYIDKAISKNPENASLLTAKGSMLEKLDRVEEAMEIYKKSIELDDTQFTPFYNISVVYFNKGVEMVNKANDIPPSEDAKYKAAIEEANNQFRLALPYIEKAYEIDGSQIAIMESLKTIYFRLRSESDELNSKYEQINEKIKSLK